MHLYFAPLACSLATRIALYEAGGEAGFVQVDTKTKRLPDGGDYRQINPLGQVPVIRTDDGQLLTENTAILQYVARRHPEAGLLGEDADLPHFQQWLSFIATEVHKGVFTNLFDSASSEEVKSRARDNAVARFDILQKRLAGREFLLDRFTVADAYLVTVLNWCRHAGIDLARWPGLQEYHTRTLQRPSIARAVREERELYMAEEAKRAA